MQPEAGVHKESDTQRRGKFGSSETLGPCEGRRASASISAEPVIRDPQADGSDCVFRNEIRLDDAECGHSDACEIAPSRWRGVDDVGQGEMAGPRPRRLEATLAVAIPPGDNALGGVRRMKGGKPRTPERAGTASAPFAAHVGDRHRYKVPCNEPRSRRCRP